MRNEENDEFQPHYEELLAEAASQAPWRVLNRALKKPKPDPPPRRFDRIEKDGAFRNGPEPVWKAARRAILLEAVRLRHIPVEQAAKVLNIGRSTGYRWLKAYLEDDVNKMRDRRYGKREKKRKAMKGAGHEGTF